MSPTVNRLIGALLLGGALAVAGYILGQYAPFTGIAQLAEPHSPIRDQTARSYAFIAGVIGFIIGLNTKSDD